MIENPEVTPPLPAISVAWDAGAQGAQLIFDPKEFRTWDFVVGVLGMALERAKAMAQMQAVQQFQQRQQAQAQHDMIRRNLNLN